VADEMDVDQCTEVPRTPIGEDADNLSPPSTTSSTDSEESESDTEPKTPVEDNEEAKKRQADVWSKGGGGRWRKPKREWVWTLGGGDHNDIKEELEYSGVKVLDVEAL